MSVESTQRPKWQIDRLLESLIDRDIRVAAQAFSPTSWTGEGLPRLRPVRDLFLPDNSRPDSLPVFFEGRLRSFERTIGVVVVCLDSPTTPDPASEGTNLFRAETVVILRGPAVVQLAFPFHVERVPTDAENYWRDLRVPRAQFEFPLVSVPKDPFGIMGGAGKPQGAVISSPCSDSKTGPSD
ncbi:MAG TPA: hypothetical protein P5534_05020 [Candidatus Paceibacterota bacterium]|nr:hypothetical protein [Candidatus Paceibacterota bacterium]HRZ55865.1 hypothetical protein [Candidatus Paceibacterota bacterium]